MEKLPNEVIQHILTDSNLSIVDVVNFSSTCFKFKELVTSNRSLWRAKYFQRWPETDVKIIFKNWYNECILRVNFENQVQQLLSTMCSEFFHLDVKKIGNSDLDFTVCLVSSHKFGYYYLRDFLISVNLLPLSESLTNKYYGNILMKFIHKKHFGEMWNVLMHLSIQEQTLEKGAIFVANWCQEYERGLWKRVTSELDDIANKVKHHLLQNFENHPIKNVPEEILLKWKKENIIGNAFKPKDCESIILAMNYMLFEDLKFCVAYDFNETDKRRFGIDFALLDKKANPFTFAVIYESIARRLGVKIEILEFPDECFLRWKDDYRVANSRSRYIVFDAEGIFISYMYPRKGSDSPIVPYNMQKIAQRAAFHLQPRELRETHSSLRDVLELKLIIEPFSLESYRQLSQIHMLHELDVKELILKLKNIRSRLSKVEAREFQTLLHSLNLYQQIWERNHETNNSEKTLVVRNRVEGVDFAVGMIVRDKFWELAGVIHEWSLAEDSPLDNRPKVYYKILLENGRCQCTLQENLQILHSPPFLSHPSIGRYFDEYCITYYKPNKELQLRYPQDIEALHKILKKDRQI